MFYLSSLLASFFIFGMKKEIPHSVIKNDFSQEKKNVEIFLTYLWSLRTIIKCGNKPCNGVQLKLLMLQRTRIFFTLNIFALDINARIRIFIGFPQFPAVKLLQ